jgi:hypothetical protein
MIDLNEYRKEVTQAVLDIKTAFTDYPVSVEWDNRDTVNMQEQQMPFLCCELVFNGGRQADLSNKPIHRLQGFVILTGKSREGTGSSDALTLVSHFYQRLQRRVIGTTAKVHTYYAELDKPRMVQGWWGVSALVPFTIDNSD